MSGEILPVKVDRNNYYFLNITNCINALDTELTTHHIYPDGSKGRYKTYEFHANRIGGIPLFKIPETCRNQVLCFEGTADTLDEFKGRYDEMGLEGCKRTVNPIFPHPKQGFIFAVGKKEAANI